MRLNAQQFKAADPKRTAYEQASCILSLIRFVAIFYLFSPPGKMPETKFEHHTASALVDKVLLPGKAPARSHNGGEGIFGNRVADNAAELDLLESLLLLDRGSAKMSLDERFS